MRAGGARSREVLQPRGNASRHASATPRSEPQRETAATAGRRAPVRGRARSAAAGLLCLLALFPAWARADTDFLGLREKLEVERPNLRAALKPSLRDPAATAFPADKPGVVFGKYLEAVWRVTDAKTSFPEVYAALHDYHGKLDPTSALQRQAFGALCGDYLQVRYGDDLIRELRAVVGFKTFNNIMDQNRDNPEIKKCFDYVAALAQSLQLEAKNRAYSTLEITLPAPGEARGAAPLAMYTHADVVRVVERKWDSPPFELKERNGRLHGLGVYDDKGPLLVNLFAMRVLRDANLTLARSLVLIVSSEGEEIASSVAAAVAPLSPRPALVLASDGEFPYATGEDGRMVARISSTRGMKSRAGIQPGQYFVHKLSCPPNANLVPFEARAWVLYAPPIDPNPALLAVNKWRARLEVFQKEHPDSRYETYIQDDTLHFFVYGRPTYTQCADKAENSMMNLAGGLTRMGLFDNSADDVLRWIEKGLQRDFTGGSIGLASEHPEMGHTWVSPVGIDRLADEVTALVDIRWPAGHDSTWVRNQLGASIAAYNAQNGTALKLDWERGSYEPAQQPPAREVQDALQEAYTLASGESAPPSPTTTSSTHVFPAAVSFGPEWPGRDRFGHTMEESISMRELQDLGVAYVAALARLAVGPLPATP